MDQSFKGKLARKIAKGDKFHLAIKHTMTTKTDNPKKRASKNKKAKASKTAKGKAK